MNVVAVEAGATSIVTLDRSDKLNAINDEMLDELLEAVETIGRADAVGAVVLTGRVRAFSAGGDIAAMDAMDDATFGATIDRYMRLAIAVRACPSRSSPPSTATRWPVASSSPSCAMSGWRPGDAVRPARHPLGLSPTSGMTWLLPRIIGLGRAMDLTLGPRTLMPTRPSGSGWSIG